MMVVRPYPTQGVRIVHEGASAAKVAVATASLFPDCESIEIGKDRGCVLFGEIDLRHLLMPGNHPVHDLCPQLLGCEAGVNITHRRSYLERAVTNSFHGVAAPALLLKDCFSSSLQLVVPGCI